MDRVQRFAAMAERTAATVHQTAVVREAAANQYLRMADTATAPLADHYRQRAEHLRVPVRRARRFADQETAVAERLRTRNSTSDRKS